MILSFAYEDLDKGWSLEEVRFDRINLLVGPSGVGKTRILDALGFVRQAGLEGAGGLPSSRWTLEMDSGGKRLLWKAETKVTYARRREGVRDVGNERLETDAHFVEEKMEVDGRSIVERQGKAFRFEGRDLPALDPKASAFELLSGSEELEPFLERLRRLSWPQTSYFFRNALGTVESAEADRQRLAGSLDALRAELTHSPAWRFYMVQRDHPELFRRISDDFIDIFPTVEEIRVDTYDALGVHPRLEEGFMASRLALGIKEEGVEGWILHTDLSAGMVKTLNLLIETTLAAQGTVFLVDEIEDGLGLNCLSDVSGLLLRDLDRIQWIATSHHPYIINNIPVERWKLVTRKGSKVTVRDADSIPALQTASPMEKFTQLINLREYEEGVA